MTVMMDVCVRFPGGYIGHHYVHFLICACEHLVGATLWRRSFTVALLRRSHTTRLILRSLSVLHTCCRR